MSLKLFYPNFKALSSLSTEFVFEKQSVNNDFPLFSISIFDDINFEYPRQSYNGKQVISIIPSDEIYSSSDLSEIQKEEYINGINTLSKIFYIKTLVNKNIPNDSIGNLSSSFALCLTSISGSVNTKYYPMLCISKEQKYTMYRSAVLINQSDFSRYSDGEIFLNVIGDYSVSLNFPINISNTNLSFSPISQSSSSSFSIIPQSNNYQQYFAVKDIDVSFYQYSNDFDYNFSEFSVPANQTLFDTTSTILMTGNNGALIRISFPSGVLTSEFNYFGITISNSSLGYDPNTDTNCSLTIRTKNGHMYIKENCAVLNNSSGYYNIIFKTHDLFFESEYVDYLLIQIKTISDITTPYSVTFLNLLDVFDDSYNTFSFKTLSLVENGNYTFDVFKNKTDVANLLREQYLLSYGKLSKVDGIVEFTPDVIYSISTENFTVNVPDSVFVISNEEQRSVFTLNSGDYIETINGPESIKIIRVRKPSRVCLVDTSMDTFYTFNGIFIKNPVYILNAKRTLLKKENPLKKTNLIMDINGEMYVAQKFENYISFDLNKNFDANKKYLLKTDIEYKRAVIIFNITSDMIISYNGVKTRIDKNKTHLVIEGDTNIGDISVRNLESFNIEKFLIQNEN